MKRVRKIRPMRKAEQIFLNPSPNRNQEHFVPSENSKRIVLKHDNGQMNEVIEGPHQKESPNISVQETLKRA